MTLSREEIDDSTTKLIEKLEASWRTSDRHAAALLRYYMDRANEFEQRLREHDLI